MVPRGRLGERASARRPARRREPLHLRPHEPGHAFTAVAFARLGRHPVRRAGRGAGDLRRFGGRRLGHRARARPVRERHDSGGSLLPASLPGPDRRNVPGARGGHVGASPGGSPTPAGRGRHPGERGALPHPDRSGGSADVGQRCRRAHDLRQSESGRAARSHRPLTRLSRDAGPASRRPGARASGAPARPGRRRALPVRVPRPDAGWPVPLDAGAYRPGQGRAGAHCFLDRVGGGRPRSEDGGGRAAAGQGRGRSGRPRERPVPGGPVPRAAHAVDARPGDQLGPRERPGTAARRAATDRDRPPQRGDRGAPDRRPARPDEDRQGEAPARGRARRAGRGIGRRGRDLPAGGGRQGDRDRARGGRTREVRGRRSGAVAADLLEHRQERHQVHAGRRKNSSAGHRARLRQDRRRSLGQRRRNRSFRDRAHLPPVRAGRPARRRTRARAGHLERARRSPRRDADRARAAASDAAPPSGSSFPSPGGTGLASRWRPRAPPSSRGARVGCFWWRTTATRWAPRGPS